MARVEERVAHLEGQVNELSQGLSAVREAIHRFEQRMDVRFSTVDPSSKRSTAHSPASSFGWLGLSSPPLWLRWVPWSRAGEEKAGRSLPAQRSALATWLATLDAGLTALTSSPTTTTATAPITLCQRKATLV